MAKLTKKAKALAAAVDKEKLHGVDEALGLIKTHATAKFDESVEIAINLGVDLGAITTGNLDMIRQYRAETNVVRRPPGEGITLVGQHELLLPLLRMAVLSKLPRVDMDPKAPR